MEKTKDFMSSVQKIAVALLLLNFLLLLYIWFIKKDSYRLENLKVWWRENMNLVQKLYKSDPYVSQQKSAIQQALSSFEWQAAQETDTSATTDTTNTETQTSQIDKSRLETIKSNSYLEWNKNARITILEFSELLCPYCKRQSDNKIMESLLKKYPSDVNTAFMHFIVHWEPAQKLAQAAECAWDLWWAKAFHSYIAQWFDIEDKSEIGMTNLAKELWIKETKFKECISSDRFISKITQNTQDGSQLFGVTWTPGNVIIDNEKWTFTLIAWAYPIEKFEEEINKILGK